MTNSLIQAALRAAASSGLNNIAPMLEQLVLETIDSTLSIDTMVQRLIGNLADLSGLSNAAPVAEGRLLEQAIAALAGCNPALTVLTNVRLPVPDAALKQTNRHLATFTAVPTLDFDSPAERSYTPDLILADPARHMAWLIDIKRSLASYDPLRRDDLKTKLLASAQVVSDLLWHGHGFIIDDIRVVILEGSGNAVDVNAGVGCFDHLDEILGVTGAAVLIERVRALFAEQLQVNFHAAKLLAFEHEVRQRAAQARKPGSVEAGAGIEKIVDLGQRRGGGGKAKLKNAGRPATVRIGFAKLTAR